MFYVLNWHDTLENLLGYQNTLKTRTLIEFLI